MWLTGRLVPDHKTIADFRKDNGTAIRKVCARFVALCRTMGLLTQASVAIDGSKFRAVNNRDRNFTRAKMERRMAQIEESVALVANAGISKAATIEETTIDDFDKLFAVNVRAPFFLVQQLLPILTKGSSVVFLSSLGARAVVGTIPACVATADFFNTIGPKRTHRSATQLLTRCGRRAKELAAGSLLRHSESRPGHHQSVQ
jgi:NAD(P)-dependent dehydrogenase (short-subunit alcohol dehydrogenase family)